MKFGLTQTFACSYLDDRDEQLLVFVEDKPTSTYHYDVLINSGFRRSGDQIYRPHCPACNACQSIRVPVEQFQPSKSQKRVLSSNRDILVQTSLTDRPEYYELYESYINSRHSDGSMYPASHQQYMSFVQCAWTQPLYLELYQQERLVGVAVTDVLTDAYSALYTFFAPDMANRSLGTLAILKQIEQARRDGKVYLYLGYQVDDCSKMNYKQKFLPHERFFANKWHLITKK